MKCASLAITLILGLACNLATPGRAAADELEPSDPFAAVDGAPVYIGEINLVLTQRVSVQDLDRIDIKVKQATALLLVRRHLAMKTLEQLGGDTLASSIDRRVEAYAGEAKRRGTSMAELAQARRSTEAAMIEDIRWTSAWSDYLKSKMTEANLRRYFEMHRDKYAGGRYDVSHIMVKVESTDPDSIAASIERMNELVAEIRGSDSVDESFAEAARQSSDSKSAGQGGHIGWVADEDDLPSGLMALVRKTQPGEISSPVQTASGLHVVLVHKSEPGTGTFDELSDQAMIRRDAADSIFEALVANQKDTKVNWFSTPLRTDSQR